MNRVTLIFWQRLLQDALGVLCGLLIVVGMIAGIRAGLFWIHDACHAAELARHYERVIEEMQADRREE